MHMLARNIIASPRLGVVFISDAVLESLGLETRLFLVLISVLILLLKVLVLVLEP